MKVLIITGTPGTGKSSLAIKLSKRLNFCYINVNKLIKRYNISEGYDKKRKTKIIDTNKLNKALIKEIDNYKTAITDKHNKIIKKGIIIDSHLSHYLSGKYVDLCIVTKCGMKTLEKRLKKKKYGNEKIRENLDAEIFDVCLNEAKESGHKVIIVDTTKGININEVSSKIGGLIGV